MSVHLGPLFHWTRKANRESILRDGIKCMEPCSDGTPAAFPWVCLATSPSTAWGLLPWDPANHDESLDLWQVTVRERDHLSIRGDFAPYIREVRFHGTIAPDRLWWVGERTAYAHETIP